MPSELQQLYEAFDDAATFARESLTIRNQAGETIPLVLSPAQIKLDALIQSIRRKGKPVRIIALKARRVYVSTGVAQQFFHQVAFTPGQRGMVVAHQLRACENVFSYYEQFDSSYQPFRGVVHKLKSAIGRSKGNNRIDYDGGGSFRILTANNVEGGRSDSIRFLHLSEYAFMKRARQLMVALMQGVPMDPDTMVLVESTANGVGNDFHKRWLEAQDPRSESEWETFFFAWWEHPGYVLALQDRASFQSGLTQEEQTDRQRYQLTLEQLHWRRWCIKNNCGGSIDTFKQEYPSCPEEAFLFSGRPRFSAKHLARMPRTANGLYGELFEEPVGTRMQLAFQVQEKGALVIYKKPNLNKRYVIGADSATGRDINDGGNSGESDPDYSVGCVLDADTGEQVAKLRARMEPDPFGEYLCALGRYYNWAFLVPESNMPGLAVIEAILRRNYPPVLIYKRRLSPDEELAQNGLVKLRLLGYNTNTVTRVQLLSGLDAAIREMSIAIRDPNTLAELGWFVIHPNGKAAGQVGTHDDEVMALALAVAGLPFVPAARAMAGIERPQPPERFQTGKPQQYGRRTRLDARGQLTRI